MIGWHAYNNRKKTRKSVTRIILWYLVPIKFCVSDDNNRKKNSKKCDSHYSLISRPHKILRERYSFAWGHTPQDPPAAEHPDFDVLPRGTLVVWDLAERHFAPCGEARLHFDVLPRGTLALWDTAKMRFGALRCCRETLWCVVILPPEDLCQ